MASREHILRDAIETNNLETSRWKKYKTENKTAINNLDSFSKHLQVRVLVPVGRKAFVPGCLIHTNEVLVGHYQGYFSECSAHKAKEICQLRVEKAEEHLKKLETEADFFRNKLYIPQDYEAFPVKDEFEEFQTEEELKLWREEHKKQVKKWKERERQERENKDKVETDIDVLKLLEEREEMDKVEIDAMDGHLVDYDIVKKLMLGDIKEPKEKKRISKKSKSLKDEGKNQKDAKLTNELQNELDILNIKNHGCLSEEKNEKMKDNEIIELLDDAELMDELEKELDILKIKSEDSKIKNNLKVAETIAEDLKSNRIFNKTELAMDIPLTNNNSVPNPEMSLPIIDSKRSDHNNDNFPAEVEIIRNQAQFLPIADRPGFYDFHKQIVEQKLYEAKLNPEVNHKELNELLIVWTSLDELADTAWDEYETSTELSENIDNEENKVDNEIDIDKEKIKSPAKKKGISFASKNETLIFRKNEAVSQMLPKDNVENATKCDVMKLDHPNNTTLAVNSPKNQKQSVLEKVEQSKSHDSEYQSIENFDLVNKIINSSIDCCETLRIHIKHSNNQSATKSNDKSEKNKAESDTEIPASPADIYDLHWKPLQENEKENTPSTLFINSFEGEDLIKVPVLRESQRSQAYENPKLQFSKVDVKSVLANETENRKIKTILKNKSAVEYEKRNVEVEEMPSNKVKKTKKKLMQKENKEEEYMSAYLQVMDEVVEKTHTVPDPLPQEKFIDSHAPKKRISRFKQTRVNNTTN